MLVEVMGRDAGWIALHSDIATSFGPVFDAPRGVNVQIILKLLKEHWSAEMSATDPESQNHRNQDLWTSVLEP